jgi:hypothetical protein
MAESFSLISAVLNFPIAIFCLNLKKCEKLRNIEILNRFNLNIDVSHKIFWVTGV